MFMFIWFIVSYFAAFCSLFLDFKFSNYGEPEVTPQEELEYDAGELAVRFIFSFIPVLNIVIICLSLYANTKTFKKAVLRNVKRMLEEVDNDE